MSPGVEERNNIAEPHVGAEPQGNSLLSPLEGFCMGLSVAASASLSWAGSS